MVGSSRCSEIVLSCNLFHGTLEVTTLIPVDAGHSGLDMFPDGIVRASRLDSFNWALGSCRQTHLGLGCEVGRGVCLMLG